MQYQIITAPRLSQLEQMVNTELSHDWQVTGGLIAFTQEHDDGVISETQTLFAQAMISFAPPKP